MILNDINITRLKILGVLQKLGKNCWEFDEFCTSLRSLVSFSCKPLAASQVDKKKVASFYEDLLNYLRANSPDRCWLFRLTGWLARDRRRKPLFITMLNK